MFGTNTSLNLSHNQTKAPSIASSQRQPIKTKVFQWLDFLRNCKASILAKSIKYIQTLFL
jgi:hypothetical protein